MKCRNVACNLSPAITLPDDESVRRPTIPVPCNTPPGVEKLQGLLCVLDLVLISMEKAKQLMPAFLPFVLLIDVSI
jgi:hypothetical protein